MRSHLRLVLLLAVALPSVAVAQPEAELVIPPGREAIVVRCAREALERVGRDPRVNIEIDRSWVRIRLPEATLVIGPPGDRSTIAGAAPIAPAVSAQSERACSAGTLDALRPLARSLAQSRDGFADRIWEAPRRTRGGSDGTAERRDPVFVVLLTVFLALSIAVLARSLRDAKGRELALLALVVAIGVVLRLVLAKATLMGVNDYSRDIAWLWRVRTNSSIAWIVPSGLHRFDLASKANFVVSSVLPIVVYAHARVFLSHRWVPIAAATIFALCPIPIAFSASNVEFVSSMALGSLALLFFQHVVIAERTIEKAVFAMGLALSFAANCELRPENLALVIVFPAALWALRARDRSLWAGSLAAAITLAIAVAQLVHLVREGAISDAGGQPGIVFARLDVLATIRALPRVLLVDNDYFASWLLPAWITVLAGIGAVSLFREDRPRFVYLALWLGSIYAAHGLVAADSAQIASRYALHTIVPVILFAGSGVEALVRVGTARLSSTRWRAIALAGATLFVVASTAPALRLLLGPATDVQQEYRFLQRLRARGLPPGGALVVEPYDRRRYPADAPRFEVLGVRAIDGRFSRVIAATRSPRAHDGPVFLYLGLPCLWRRENSACERALASGPWRLVERASITGIVHDSAASPTPARGTIALYHWDPAATGRTERSSPD